MGHIEWSSLLAIMAALTAGWLADSVARIPHLSKFHKLSPLVGAVLAGSTVSLLWWFF